MSQSINDTLEQNYNQNYNKLKNIVGHKPEFGSSISNHNQFNINLLKTYGVIFVIILFSLILLKPSNLVTYTTENGSTKIDIFQLFKYTIIFSLIILCVYKMPEF